MNFTLIHPKGLEMRESSKSRQGSGNVAAGDHPMMARAEKGRVAEKPIEGSIQANSRGDAWKDHFRGDGHAHGLHLDPSHPSDPSDPNLHTHAKSPDNRRGPFLHQNGIPRLDRIDVGCLHAFTPLARFILDLLPILERPETARLDI
jgi:hypothetical protein